jgi:hypothetical protein
MSLAHAAGYDCGYLAKRGFPNYDADPAIAGSKPRTKYRNSEAGSRDHER